MNIIVRKGYDLESVLQLANVLEIKFHPDLKGTNYLHYTLADVIINDFADKIAEIVANGDTEFILEENEKPLLGFAFDSVEETLKEIGLNRKPEDYDARMIIHGYKYDLFKYVYLFNNEETISIFSGEDLE